MSSPLLLFTILVYFTASAWGANFIKDLDVSWGGDNAKLLNNAKLLALSLDQSSGAGFQSKSEYLFGRFDMQIKLEHNDSAGTVTAYYLSSLGPTHDEVDLEFLGNLSGQPYILHTNIYTQGLGNREQQFYLWFDPAASFHTYSVLWNPHLIVFYVDGTPIRAFRNMESQGISYPNKQPMRLYGSIWDGEEWATQGGRVKINWAAAPFTANFRNFKANACVWSSEKHVSWCNPNVVSNSSKFAWLYQDYFNSSSLETLKTIQHKYMVYDYCADTNRFPQGLPLECTIPI